MTSKNVNHMQSEQVAALEKAFRILNDELFESALSTPMITVNPTPCKNGTIFGHCTSWEAWESADGGEKYREINLNAEQLNRPILDTIETLVHEMVHFYCYQNQIKDTSRSGWYHNERFKQQAEAHGLIVEKSEKYGYNITKPSPRIEKLVADGLFSDNIAAFSRKAKVTGEESKPKSSTRKYQCPGCGNSVRATKEVNIICGDCKEQYELV